MTFGSKEEQSHVCKLTVLNVVLKNRQTRPLKLFVVPLICEPVTCKPVSFCQDNFDHLAQLDLADPSDGSSHLDIDVLIGCDQYWELVTGETRRGNSGPVALNTELGWILSGPVASPAWDTPSTCLVTQTLRVDGSTHDEVRMTDSNLFGS